MLFANFDAFTGECMYCGESQGDVQLPKTFKGKFPKRYRMVDGKVVDQYAGKTDEEAESLWLKATFPETFAE
jgi:hypothetical protein